MTDYEEMQLELIGQTYRERGFTVRSQYRFRGEAYLFDAVARKGRRDIVIIEIVNKHRNAAQRAVVLAIERIRERMPTAVVDFRYIDVEAGALQTAIAGGETLRSIRLQNLPDFPPERAEFAYRIETYDFLDLWLYYVDLIRAYASYSIQLVEAAIADERADSIQSVYNELLRTGRLIAPEDTVDDVNVSFFGLYGSMLAAVQGASVSQVVRRQLRLHVSSVRQQIAAHLDAERRRE